MLEQARAGAPAMTRRSAEIERTPITARPAGEGMFLAADLACGLGIDGKIARARLRRRFGRLDQQGETRWRFPESGRSEISRIIRGE
jgi:hypothetical protein